MEVMQKTKFIKIVFGFSFDLDFIFKYVIPKYLNEINVSRCLKYKKKYFTCWKFIVNLLVNLKQIAMSSNIGK